MIMKFRLLLIYMFVGFLCSCSLDEVYEQGKDITSLKDGLIEVPFSISVPGGIELSTKAMAEDPDISTLHLIVFDDNGYYVETQQAEFTEEVTDHNHYNEKKYTVNLTQTDQPRKIHIVANCPVSQVSYGHEAEIMSNLYVEGNATAYWGRIEVPNIMQTVDSDSDGIIDSYSSELLQLFKCVALLRNFSQIKVINKADNFEMTGFAVYNTIDKGTVVPYNKSTSTFQNFQKTSGSNKTYDELLNENYEGHALSSVTLKSTLVNKPVNEGGDFYAAGSSFYMYERKVSVNTSDESSWKESPPHIIVKGKYNNSEDETFYKIDLIRTVEVGGAAINQFYNILRNFCYSFTINQIVDYGYETLAEAMANPAGNNLAGSSDTQGFTNLSDGLGRIFVEYTDMTLVTNDDVTLRYKYIPDIRDDNVDNSKILINGIYDDDDNPIGPVFDSYTIGSDDSEGWRTVTFEVNDVSGEVKHQDIVLITTDNSNLNRTIKYTLRNYFPMTLECAPKKVTSSSGQEIRVDIKVPDDLTENLFPLSFDIEDTQLSLSPNSVKNQLPVTVSKSIIPGKESVQTFHYTKKVTWDEYLSYTKSGGQAIIPTYFKTNKGDNASVVHAYNYYFRERITNNRTARDNFENAIYSFSDIKPASAGWGVGKTVSFSFNMQSGAYNREVTVTFDGLEDSDGQSTFTFTPTKNNDITIPGVTLQTTTPGEEITVTIDAPEYAVATHTITRTKFNFTGEFDGTLNGEAGQTIDYTFTIPDDGYTAGMVVNVEFDGLEFANGNPDNDLWTDKGNGKWEYRPTASTYSKTEITLKTTEEGTRTNYVTLYAEGFNNLRSDISQANEINLVIKFLWNHGNAPDPNTGFKIADFNFTINNGSVQVNSLSAIRTGDNYNYNYTITMTGVNIQGNSNSNVTISYKRKGGGSTTYTYSKTMTISELLVTKEVTLIQQ